MDAREALARWAAKEWLAYGPGGRKIIEPEDIGDVRFEGFYSGPGCETCGHEATTGISVSIYDLDMSYIGQLRYDETISIGDIVSTPGSSSGSIG